MVSVSEILDLTTSYTLACNAKTATVQSFKTYSVVTWRSALWMQSLRGGLRIAHPHLGKWSYQLFTKIKPLGSPSRQQWRHHSWIALESEDRVLTYISGEAIWPQNSLENRICPTPFVACFSHVRKSANDSWKNGCMTFRVNRNERYGCRSLGSLSSVDRTQLVAAGLVRDS